MTNDVVPKAQLALTENHCQMQLQGLGAVHALQQIQGQGRALVGVQGGNVPVSYDPVFDTTWNSKNITLMGQFFAPPFLNTN